MKIDYEYIKQILEVLRDHASYEMASNELMEKLGVQLDHDRTGDFDKFYGHVCLLGDERCLEADSDYGFQKSCCEDRWTPTGRPYRMTSRGYEFLDLLSEQTVLKRIKNLSLSAAFEVGKALLIEVVKKGVVG